MDATSLTYSQEEAACEPHPKITEPIGSTGVFYYEDDTPSARFTLAEQGWIPSPVTEHPQ